MPRGRQERVITWRGALGVDGRVFARPTEGRDGRKLCVGVKGHFASFVLFCNLCCSSLLVCMYVDEK